MRLASRATGCRGCFYLIRSEVIETRWFVRSAILPLFEEVDHCRSLNGGWEVIYYPCAPVTTSAAKVPNWTSGLDDGQQVLALHAESEFLYYRKHYGIPPYSIRSFLRLLIDLGRALKRVIVAQNVRQALAP